MVVGTVVVAAVAVAVFVATTRGSGKATANDTASGAPITILWIGDTTGPLKVYGDVQLAGVRGAADYFNRSGGIDGHRVVVHAVSDNGDPAVASSVLTQQLAKKTPTMVWAGSTATDSGALIPILARHDVFAIALTDGQAQCKVDASKACPHEWVLTITSDVAPTVAATWFGKRHITKVGVLEDASPYSTAETPQLVAAAKERRITVKALTFPPSAVDLTPQLQELKQAGVQAVYAEGIGVAKYVFAARANLNWNVPLLFNPSASALDLTKLTTRANTENAYEDNLYETDGSVPNRAVQTMIKWAKPHANVLAVPINVTSTGWDAVVDLNAAVHAANGSLNVADLDTAMTHLPPVDPLRTLTHKLGYTKDNHEDVLGRPGDYVVLPVGPIVSGQVQAP